MIRSVTCSQSDINKSQPSYKSVGGIARVLVKSGDMKNICRSIQKRESAAAFNGALKGKTVVILGNSYTLRGTRWRSLRNLPAIGCNRALLSTNLWPEYVMCADREVFYCVRGTGAWFRGAKAGVKLLFAESLFDPSVVLRGSGGVKTKEWLWAHAVPGFKWYRYTSGHKDKTWTYNDVIAGTVVPPYNFTDLGQPLVSGQTILVQVLQAALAMGANKIISVGFEVSWPKKGRTHFVGKRKHSGGDWEHSFSIIRKCLGHIKEYMDSKGIRLYNLSPVKDSLFAGVFGNHTYEEALR